MKTAVCAFSFMIVAGTWKEYDLSRWVFTKKIRLEPGVRPHSHSNLRWFVSEKSGNLPGD
jgi:hypothetical protein